MSESVLISHTSPAAGKYKRFPHGRPGVFSLWKGQVAQLFNGVATIQGLSAIFPAGF